MSRQPAEKAVLLARVSSKEQEDGYSLEAQDHRMTNYCLRHDLEVVRVFQFVESSTQGDRREFTAMIEFVKKQKGTIAIVADKVDRVQRSFKEFPMLDALIQQGKIELHFVTENYIIHKNSVSQERLMWSMGVIMAQSYVDNLRDNVKRSFDQKIRLGECITRAPIGYLNIQDARNRGDVIIDDIRAPIVRKIFETYATGTHTLSEMRKKAAAWGLKSRTGKQDYLKKSQIYAILNNPFYYGVMSVKGQLYDHKYPPLITKSLFDKCQDILKGWNKKKFQWGGKEYIFRGLLRCAITGGAITADTKQKTYASGKTASWTYLRVPDPENLEKLLWVREDKIVSQVEDALNGLHISPTFLKQIINEIRRVKKNQIEYQRRLIGELQKEHSLIQNRIEQLLNLMLDGGIGREEYEKFNRGFRKEQKVIETKLAQSSNNDEAVNYTLISLVSAVGNASTLFEKAPIELKRQIINMVFANLSLRGDKLLSSFRNPLGNFPKNEDIDEWRAFLNEARTNEKYLNQIREFKLFISPIESYLSNFITH